MKLNWKIKLFLLSISQFFYRAGTRSIIPILPILIKGISSSDNSETILWSGWILSSPFLISFFTTPFWGTTGDKIGRNYTTFLAAFGFVLSQIGLSFSTSLTLVLIAFSIQEIFGGAYPAAVSFTTIFVPKEKVADSLSYLQFSNALGNILGPLIGGLITDNYGIKYVFLLFAFTVFVFSFPILFFKENLVLEKKQSVSLKNNFIFFIKNKYLIVIAIVLLSYTLSVTMIRPVFTLFIQKQFGEIKNLATLSGLLFTLFGLSSAISNLILPFVKKFFPLNKILKFSLLVSSSIFIILSLANTLILFGVLIFLSGFALGVVLPILYSLMSENINQSSKAGVMGIGSSFQMIGNLVGPTLAGFIFSLIGIDFSFASCGFVLLIGFILFNFYGVSFEKIS